MLLSPITDIIRVAFYVRVSTEEQSKDGFGIDMQLYWLKDMITYRGKISGWVHEEGMVYQDLWCTGADLNRPGFKQMMEDAKAGKFDMVAVWKIDRLSRNLSHLLSVFETLQKQKVGFFSLKENIDFTWPIGKLTFQIFWALAEFERETIKARTSEWKRTSARFGNYVLSGTPFWYMKDGSDKKRNRTLKKIESEARWVERIFQEFLNGTNREQIAKILNDNKVPKNDATLSGKKHSKWYNSAITDMLKNPVYTGRAVYNSTNENGTIEQIEIPTPRIISDIEFELVQEKLADDNTVERWGGGKEYLLSRKIIDMETGRKFVWLNRPKDQKTTYRRKAFTDTNSGKTFKNLEIPGEPLEKKVWDTIEAIINRPDELFEVFERQSVDSQEYQRLSEELDINIKRIKKLDDKEISIEDDYYEGRTSEEKKIKHIESIVQERNAITKRNIELNEKMDAIIKIKAVQWALEKFKTEFATNVENLSFEQKRLLIELLLERVEVTLVSSQQYLNIKVRFDPSRLIKNEGGVEPKKGSPEPQSGTEKPDSIEYGATSRARTCDLLLRREAL